MRTGFSGGAGSNAASPTIATGAFGNNFTLVASLSVMSAAPQAIPVAAQPVIRSVNPLPGAALVAIIRYSPGWSPHARNVRCSSALNSAGVSDQPESNESCSVRLTKTSFTAPASSTAPAMQ